MSKKTKKEKKEKKEKKKEKLLKQAAKKKMQAAKKGETAMDKACFLSEKGPKPVGPYSTACVSGGLVFLSGVIALDPAKNQLVEGGLEAQAEQVLKNIRTILGEMNLDFTHVVKTNVFMTDMSKFAVFNQLYGQYFTENCPARSAVEVSALPLGAEIEVELVAAVPETGVAL